MDFAENETAGSVGPDVPLPCCHREKAFGLGEVTGNGTGEHRGMATRNDDAHVTASTQDLRDRGERLPGVVDIFQEAVAQHEIDRSRVDMFGEVCGVALKSRDRLGDSLFDGPSMQGGQRIGARVDHGHTMTGLRKPYGVASSAATEIENVDRRGIATGEGHSIKH